MKIIRTLTLPLLALLVVPAMAQSTNAVPVKESPAFKGTPYDTNLLTNQILGTAHRRAIRQKFEPQNRILDPVNNLRAGNMSWWQQTKPGARFPAINVNESGSIPPDPDIAVGPSHAVVVVNTHVGFFNKTTGQRTFFQALTNTGFFSDVAQTNFQFDPKVFFDPQSQRFFIVILENNLFVSNPPSKISNYLVAVSDDSDPNGVWFRYRFDSTFAGPNNTFQWADYPGWGFNSEAVVATANMFGFTETDPSGGVDVSVFNKSDLINNLPTVSRRIRLGSDFTVQVSRLSDAADNNTTVYAASTGNGSTIRLFAFRNLLTGTLTSTAVNLTVPSYTPAFSAPTTGGLVMDTIDGRILNAFRRGTRLVAAHAVTLNSRTAVRWYDINLGTWPTSGSPTLVQSGHVQGRTGSLHAHMPAIAQNARGDISIIHTQSGTATPADIAVSGRTVTDPLGSIGAPTTLISSPPGAIGDGMQVGPGFIRWGDYFGIAVDPVDQNVFWGVGQTITNGGGWLTQFFSWTVVQPIGLALSNLQLVYGTLNGGNLASMSTTDGSLYEIASAFVNRVGQVAGFTVDSVLPGTDGLRSIEFAFNARAARGATGSIQMWNWSQNRWEQVGSFLLTDTLANQTVVVRTAANSPYIQPGTLNIRVAIRAIQPLRQGRPTALPAPFTFAVDRFAVTGNF